ncbi:hypothetical protein FRC12_013878 [Ceratobasidium sp. 428]|nr:hypothetical protein FRC12_013878 [Ceratobasidium sp. 428]
MADLWASSPAVEQPGPPVEALIELNLSDDKDGPNQSLPLAHGEKSAGRPPCWPQYGSHQANTQWSCYRPVLNTYPENLSVPEKGVTISRCHTGGFVYQPDPKIPMAPPTGPRIHTPPQTGLLPELPKTTPALA